MAFVTGPVGTSQLRSLEQGVRHGRMLRMRDGLKSSDLEGLAAWVKHHGAEGQLTLPFPQAKGLLESLRQLQQGAVLLRKQNKKLRLRVAQLKEAAGAAGIDTGDDADLTDPEPS